MCWHTDFIHMFLPDEGDITVVAEHIKRIRAKFKLAGAGDHIETVWGVGYKWK